MSADLYLSQSLGATGFCLLAPDIAMRLRPDLWPNNGGLQCTGDFARAVARNSFAGVPHTIKLTVSLAGMEQPVVVLARSTLRLAERIEEVTGLRVEQLVEGDEAPEPARGDQQRRWEVFKQRRQTKPLAAEAAAVPSPPRREQVIPADVQGLDIQAKEPPRPCTACGNLTNGGNCLPALKGKWRERPPYYQPSASNPRRCLHYVPGHHLLTGDHVDMRNGIELWPELLQKREPAGALGKARELLDDMLTKGPRNAGEILAALQEAGLSERTIQRASEQLGVIKAKDGRGGWTWALPAEQGAKAVA
jgi:hypothetical protein